MKRYIVCISLLIFLIPFSAISKNTLSNGGIRAINVAGTYTYYSWKVDVESDENIQNCIIYVSMRDKDGFEIESTSERVQISKGLNHFTGQHLCKTDTWKEIKEFVIQIKTY